MPQPAPGFQTLRTAAEIRRRSSGEAPRGGMQVRRPARRGALPAQTARWSEWTRGRVDGRQTRPSARPAIRRSIPVRTFGDWNNPLPGFMEADLVSHGGENVAGSFAHTLVLTDIASGWTECVALAVREGSLIVEALTRLRTTMPFPLRGFDTDNGSEFINETVLAYCTETKIEFMRG